jgi:hypothetical protein
MSWSEDVQEMCHFAGINLTVWQIGFIEQLDQVPFEHMVPFSDMAACHAALLAWLVLDPADVIFVSSPEAGKSTFDTIRRVLDGHEFKPFVKRIMRTSGAAEITTYPGGRLRFSNGLGHGYKTDKLVIGPGVDTKVWQYLAPMIAGNTRGQVIYYA